LNNTAQFFTFTDTNQVTSYKEQQNWTLHSSVRRNCDVLLTN